MASQYQLEEWIAEEKARLAILRIEYERLTDDDNLNANAIAQAKLLRQTQILPLEGRLATLEIRLEALLEVPEEPAPEQIEITSNRPIAQKPIVSDIPDTAVSPGYIIVTEPETDNV
jgi:small-conductance mechanosensitive channel